MKSEKKFFQSIHSKTKRDYLSIMNNSKPHYMDVAKKFSKDFFDGERKYGYGGHKYIPGWWSKFTQKIITNYNLVNNSNILDIGCGKGFLLHDLKIANPLFQLSGFDISKYAIKNAKKEIKKNVFCYDIKNNLNFYKKNSFDLVLSINTLHNLEIFELKKALKEIVRISKRQYIVVESYRNSRELFNLQCWNKTGLSFFSKKEWIWLFKEYGYKGDYDFIYFK